MASLSVMDAVEELHSGYPATSCDADGDVVGIRFEPDGCGLWEGEAVVPAGSGLRWGASHDDEVLFVLDGELDVDGTTCGTNSAVVIEAGARTRVEALRDSRIVHFGQGSPVDPGSRAGARTADATAVRAGVHVVTFDETRPTGGELMGARYYADSTCDTCNVAFFYAFLQDPERFADGPHVAASHVHSEDEIIRVLSGELQFGRITLTPGMSIAVPGGHRYGFRAPGPFAFLNYRADASTYTGAPGSTPFVETVDNWLRRDAAE